MAYEVLSRLPVLAMVLLVVVEQIWSMVEAIDHYHPAPTFRNPMYVFAVALAAAIYSAMGGESDPVVSVFDSTIYILAATAIFVGVGDAANLDPTTPRWWSETSWVELEDGVIMSSLTIYHQVVMWMAGFFCLGTVAHLAIGIINIMNDPKGVDSTQLPSPQKGYLAVRVMVATHQLVAVASALVVAVNICMDLAFHETPTWQLYDAPLFMLYMSFAFGLRVSVSPLDISWSHVAVDALLLMLGLAMATAYVAIQIEHVAGDVIWTDTSSYFEMFPVGGRESKLFGGMYRYVSSVDYIELDAHKFSGRNTILHQLGVAAVAIGYCRLTMVALIAATRVIMNRPDKPKMG